MEMALMEYNGYHASIEYDNEDKIFTGTVIGITDSLNFHGYSVDELEENFRQSVDNYIELCKKLGKDPEREYRGSLNIRLTPVLHRSAALFSAEDKISINQFIVDAVAEKCRARGALL
ncbi:MAG: type II toxin-antitoxin system HicB family antitoxin [Clostridiales bacterium]|nr:type II toxin-antitoxin system HicB family antitoxin [Clostridiales bacterium]